MSYPPKSSLYLSFLFFLAIGFYSCKKDPIVLKFKGTVTDRFLGNRIDGVSVTISQKKLVDGALGSSYQLAGSAITDANGDFNIEFAREKATEFLIEYEKENYFSFSRPEGSAAISSGTINNLDQTMDSKAWIQFDILHELGDSTDEYKIIKQNFREGCYGCAKNNTLTFQGLIDTSITYLTTGGTYVKFVKINVTNEISELDSIYTTPFETTTYQITY